MQKLGLNEIRERYLKFFESKDHLRVNSFSLVPQKDPSLLLINSGMAPLKPYFTGAEEPPRRRMTTCQKCIRTPDIENVGKTARHGTFFEMLGNFSFGDYFKKEATAWAWEFITQDMKLPEDRVFVSIYEEDDEAFDIWTQHVGIPGDKIFRMGKKDNFWEHGVGPCGPCSEIYFDRGPEKGCGSPDCTVGCDCDRYIEFWNLVFTQFYRNEDGTYDRLANPNIDTGMGLERLACVMQEVDNLFEVDTVRAVLDTVCQWAGVEYQKDAKTDVSIRVITDHVRSTTMMICDGVVPSNEGRGYVLRRLLRRAARHGRLLGIKDLFLHKLCKVVIECSKAAYPELESRADYIQKVIRIEEERFQATVDQGLVIIRDYMSEVQAAGGTELSGDKVFKLHDTYGFPLDLTREICEESGLTIDEAGFREQMQIQKTMAREAMKKDQSAWGETLAAGIEKSFRTQFNGYEHTKGTAKVAYIIKDGELTEAVSEGDVATLLLDVTTFYGESGGQAGDSGRIYSDEFEFQVVDTKKTADGKFLHVGTVVRGLAEKSLCVTTEVDAASRKSTARNHTTTHLLHKALRNVLGDHVAQAGSSVDSDRLRFDFNHFTALTREELKQVEDEVNEVILSAIPVSVREMAIEDAKNEGAMALFGEKYGDTVRVVKAGDYSTELCGGTHLTNTAEAGFIKILSETGVAAGVRRIEALTGFDAIRYYQDKENQLEEIATALKATPAEAVRRVESLYGEVRQAEKEVAQLRQKLVAGALEDVLANAVDVKGMKLITARFDHLDMDGLRDTADTVRQKIGSGVVVLVSNYGQKVNFVAAATKDAVAAGVHSGNLLKGLAAHTGGGGGGRPDMAQAGGRDIAKIDSAMSLAAELLSAQIK